MKTIQAKFRNSPTDYAQNYEMYFQSIEDVLKHMCENSNITLISVKENNEYHFAVIGKDGRIVITPCVMFLYKTIEFKQLRGKDAIYQSNSFKNAITSVVEYINTPILIK
jgi:hypothetical protein